LAAGGALIALAAGAALPPGAMATMAVAARPVRDRPVPIHAPPGTLADKIDAVLDGEPGVYGVVAANRAGDTLYARNPDLPFVAASLYKLIVMAAVLEARAAGTLVLAEPMTAANAGWLTVGDALDAMISHSNNEAGLALYGRVGGDAVNGTAARLGLTRTRVACDPSAMPFWPPSPVANGAAADQSAGFVLGWAATVGLIDLTTARDTARFFARLLDGAIVDRRSCTRMYRPLLRQTINDRFPALLPKRTIVAHKTGNLPGVVHDAGVIYAPAGPVVLVVLAQDVPDESRATALLQQVAALVYEAGGGRVRAVRRAEDGPPVPRT
jgi:beta-lactamase class A